jgi:hypothetical protein
MVSWPITPDLKGPSATPAETEASVAPVATASTYNPVRVGIGALIMTGILAGMGLATDSSPLNAFSGNTVTQGFTPEQLRELGIVTAPTGVVVPTLHGDSALPASGIDGVIAARPPEPGDGEFDPLMADNPKAAQAALARQALLRRPILILASAQTPVKGPVATKGVPVASGSATKAGTSGTPLVLKPAQTGALKAGDKVAGGFRVAKPVQIVSSRITTESQSLETGTVTMSQPITRRRGVVGGASARQMLSGVPTASLVISGAHFDATRQALVLPYAGRVTEGLRLNRLRDGRVYLDLAGARLGTKGNLGDRPNLESVTRWAVANQAKGGVRVVLAVNVTCDPAVTVSGNALTIALSPLTESRAPARAAVTTDTKAVSRTEAPTLTKASLSGTAVSRANAVAIKTRAAVMTAARLSAAQFDAGSKRLVIPYTGTLRDGAIHMHRLPDGRAYLDIRQASTSFAGTRHAEPRDHVLTRWSMAAKGDGRVRLAFEPRLPGRVDVAVLPGVIQVSLPKHMVPRVRSRPDTTPSQAADFAQPVAPSFERTGDESALIPFIPPDEGVSQ